MYFFDNGVFIVIQASEKQALLIYVLFLIPVQVILSLICFIHIVYNLWDHIRSRVLIAFEIYCSFIFKL